MNKKVIIIGGTSGIGFSISELFAKKKYNVTVVSSNIQNLQKTLYNLKKINENCSYIKCDLKNEVDVKNLNQIILDQGECIECVVFASCKGLFGKIDEINNEKFINYFKTFAVSYLKILKIIFNNKKTRIIYLSSYIGHFNIPNYNVYSFIKVTVDNFLEKLKVEIKKGRILIAYPGSVKTDFDEKSELIGNFKLRNSKNKKSAEEVAKKILKSYESFDDVFHSSILMKFLFFLKNIFPGLINYILKFFFK